MFARKAHVYAFLRSLGFGPTSEMLMVEQFRLIAQQIPILYSVIIINCLFMAALASTQVSALFAFAFPGAAIPIMLFRIGNWRRLTRRLIAAEDYIGMRKALRVTTIMANVLAAVLAVWSIVILLQVPPDKVAFVPVFTILSMITCAYCLSAYPIAAYSVMLSGSTYIAVAMAWTGDKVLVAMALNIGLVSVMVVYMARHQFGQLRRLVRSTDRLRLQRSHARDLAFQDQLTGLSNRRALIEQMRRRKARNDPSPVGLIMIDLNGFKPVNDTFGHPAGDRLLITISERLVSALGKEGLVARIGGDEFCVFLPSVPSTKFALDLADRIKAAIKSPLVLDGHALQLGSAIGTVVSAPGPIDPLELLQCADIALYEAKSQGGNAIKLFEPQMEARFRRRTLIEHALADNEQARAITLEYQPIFTLRSHELIGYEALARWNHPVLGTIHPSEFVEIAERSGKARRLTLFLFKQAIRTARDWPPHLTLSFNLSGSGLATAGFERSLPTILNDLGFSPERLVLEVTETALLGDLAAAQRVLRELQSHGIRIALDDFGAGHASIGYLRDLEFDGIKLDGSLIRQITVSQRSRQLLMGVLQLCRSIGVSVTAEQVEKAEQLEALQAFPIDSVQGFYLGRPTGLPVSGRNRLHERQQIA